MRDLVSVIGSVDETSEAGIVMLPGSLQQTRVANKLIERKPVPTKWHEFDEANTQILNVYFMIAP